MSHLEIPSAPVEPHASLDPGVVVPADGEARALCHATQCAMERLRCSGPRAKRGDRSAVVVDCVAESNEDLDLRLAVFERHEVVGGRIEQHVPIITDLRTAVTTDDDDDSGEITELHKSTCRRTGRACISISSKTGRARIRSMRNNRNTKGA